MRVIFENAEKAFLPGCRPALVRKLDDMDYIFTTTDKDTDGDMPCEILGTLRTTESSTMCLLEILQVSEDLSYIIV